MKNPIHLSFIAAILLFIQACENQYIKPDLSQNSLSDASNDYPDILAVDANKRIANYVAHLTGDAEVPPVETNATGQVKFQLNKEGTELYYKLIVANIENVVASHIHLGPEDQNGPVVAFLFSGAEASPNGILAEGTITDSDVIGLLAGSLEDLVDAIREGNTYVNVHTTANPGGEIRGQIR